MLKYSIFMSTSLENTGVSLNSKLWTAKIFCEAREEWWEEEGREAGRQWRVSEKKLIGLALIGGSVGAFIGMIVFHHKVRKWYFKLGIPAILVTQLTITIHFIPK